VAGYVGEPYLLTIAGRPRENVSERADGVWPPTPRPRCVGGLEALGPVRVELRVRASGCYLAVGAVTSGSAALPGSLSSAAVIGFGRVRPGGWM